MSPPRLLCAWTQDDVLAQRSGYHVIADYLPAEKMVEPRRDPSGLVARWRTRLMRRLCFSRWCMGGSMAVDRRLRAELRQGFQGIIHYLWCDRDFAFLDREPKRAGVSLVGTFHHPPDQLREIVRRPQGLRVFDAIILMSSTQQDWFLQQGVSEKRLHVIPHGVDTAFFSPPVASAGGGGVRHVLAVGATGRNFPLLREVAAHFGQSPDIRFVIIGPEHERAAFAGMLNVTYRTRVPDEELLNCYRNADCLLHLTTQATANNVILEALACGVPVIAQRVGGVPEYLTHECAVLTEPGDFPALAHALESHLANPANVRRMSAAARQHAESLSWERVAARTMELYLSLQA
ncbi:glycosyltransferase family 4 protein [Prosthecobacter vanneervenii]